MSQKTPELFCNLLITLIYQTNYLLDHQLHSLEKSFVEKGGLRERMYRARISERNALQAEALSLLRGLYREAVWHSSSVLKYARAVFLPELQRA